MRNTYRIDGDSVYIALSKKNNAPETIISLEDLPRLLEVDCIIQAIPRKNGTYARIEFYPTSNRNRTGLHRFIMNPPNNLLVDHINHDPLDNRRSNLRVVTSAENNQNKRARSDSKTGYRGVHRRGNKWVAYAWVESKIRYLGTYDSPEAASFAVSNFRAMHQPYSPDARIIDNPISPNTLKNPVNRTSGITGIYWRSRESKWHVLLHKDKKQHSGGSYVNIEDAKVALEALKQKIGYSR